MFCLPGWTAAAPRVCALVVPLVLTFVSTDSSAFGFGVPQVSSALGQPLLMRIPVRIDSEVDLTPQCMRLVPNITSDVVPTLTMARLTLEKTGEEQSIRIDSLNPINEPVMRVNVEAGCAQRVRREFVLFLDPPVTEPQMASAVAPSHAAETPMPDLGVGIAKVTGRVGQTLAMRIPVTGANADALDANCVHLGEGLSADGAPVLQNATINVTHEGGESAIELSTSDPVIEPALRVILEVGCDVPIRREYGVLLEMPAPAAPAQLAEESPAAAPVPEPEQPAPPPPPPPKAHPRRVHKTEPPVTRTSPLAHADTAQAAPPVAAPVVSPKEEAAPKPKAAAAKAEDRLVLAAPPEEAPAPDSPLVRLEEMDKRVQALTTEVNNLRSELVAARQREADAEAREQRSGTTWILGVLAAIAVIVGGILMWQRRRSDMAHWNQGSWTPEPAPEAPAAPHAEHAAARDDASGESTRPAQTRPAPITRSSPLTTHADMLTELPLDTSTILPLPPQPVTTIEVTEIHEAHEHPEELEKLYTIFNDQGAMNDPAPAASPRPTIVASQQAHGDLQFEDMPYTQTPTQVALDLDLSTRITPRPDSPLRFDTGTDEDKHETEKDGAGTTRRP
jgi:hypothetical protein